MCDNKNSNGRFLRGAAYGVVFGAVLGILLAPQAGKQTRRILKKKGVKYLEEGRDTYETIVSELDPLVQNLEKIKTLAAPIKQELSYKVAQLLKEYENNLDTDGKDPNAK